MQNPGRHQRLHKRTDRVLSKQDQSKARLCFLYTWPYSSHSIQDREAHLQTLTIELTHIFNHLKKCMVDKDILKVNQEILGPSEADKTQQYTCLFDYISDQDIIDLQRQADDEIGEIEVSKIHA